MISEAATQPDGSATHANYSYYGAAPSRIVMKRVVSLDGQLNLTVALLGKRTPLEYVQLSCNVSSSKDIEVLVRRVSEICLCAGGPSADAYENVQPTSGFIDVTGRWHHNSAH